MVLFLLKLYFSHYRKIPDYFLSFDIIFRNIFNRNVLQF